jgi:hypothetical protein
MVSIQGKARLGLYLKTVLEIAYDINDVISREDMRFIVKTSKWIYRQPLDK